MITILNTTEEQRVRLQIAPLESLVLDSNIEGGWADEEQTDELDGGNARSFAIDDIHGGVADFGKAGHRLTLSRATSRGRYIINCELTHIANGQVDVTFSLPFEIVLGEYRYSLHNMGGVLSQGVLRVTDKLYKANIKTIYE